VGEKGEQALFLTQKGSVSEGTAGGCRKPVEKKNSYWTGQQTQGPKELWHVGRVIFGPAQIIRCPEFINIGRVVGIVSSRQVSKKKKKKKKKKPPTQIWVSLLKDGTFGKMSKNKGGRRERKSFRGGKKGNWVR